MDYIKGAIFLCWLYHSGTEGSDAIGGVLNVVAALPAPTRTLQGSYTGNYFSNTKGKYGIYT